MFNRNIEKSNILYNITSSIITAHFIINLEFNFELSVNSCNDSRVSTIVTQVDGDIEVPEVLAVLDHLEHTNHNLALLHVELIAEEEPRL